MNLSLAFDLLPITPVVTQYLRLRGVCSGCGYKLHATLPTGLPSGQLGLRALALVGTLSGQFHLTQGKIQRLLAQVVGPQVQHRHDLDGHGYVAQALAEPVQQLQRHLSQEPVRHARLFLQTAETCPLSKLSTNKRTEKRYSGILRNTRHARTEAKQGS